MTSTSVVAANVFTRLDIALDARPLASYVYFTSVGDMGMKRQY